MNENRREEQRREDDREWIRNVDHQIVTLLTGHQVLDRRLTQIEEVMRDLDLILRGDPSDERDGMLSQLHKIQTDLARINAVLFMDSTGKAGLVKDVLDMKGEENRKEIRWKNYIIPILAAIISGLLAKNWDELTAFVRKPTTDPLEKKIEDAKGPKIVYHHYRVVQKADE